ncbi:MAG: protein kinase [Verrucomicrobiota bacterium]
MANPFDNPNRCPDCGTPIPEDSTHGLCPKCLLSASADSAPVPSTEEPKNQRTEEPPSHDPDATIPLDPTKTVAAPKSDAPRAPEELQALFPDLEIIELLGAGGMGAVYKARQPRLDRLVALKVLTCPPEHYDNFALRFEREAQTLARLNHPNIVTIYDFGELKTGRDERPARPPTPEDGPDSIFYFIMEFVDGADLNDLIKTGDLTPEQALRIVPQICDALQYAHDEGITHRDIKPANILMGKRGKVRIADFGLAKLIGGETPDDENPLVSGLTVTGTTMGTPHYMAPEQWEAPEKVDHRADIYSLGVVFYEMLTGERPAGAFKPPSKKTEAIDKRLDDVVLKAMEKDPEDRYQRATEVKDDVTVVTTTKPRSSFFKHSHSKAPNPHRRLLIAASLILALAAGAYLLSPLNHFIKDYLTTTITNNEEQVSESPTPEATSSGLTGTNTATGIMPAFPLPRPQRPGDPGKLITLSSGDDLQSKPTGLADLPNDLDDVVAITLSNNFGKTSGDDPDIPSQHALALHDDGTVTAWGRNTHGETDIPKDLKNCVAIAVGQKHSVALHGDGTVTAWGDVEEQIEEIKTWKDVVAIAAAPGRTMGLTTGGTILAAAQKERGFKVPSDLQGSATSIAAGGKLCLAILDDGTVRSWGESDILDVSSLHRATDVRAAFIADVAGRTFTVDSKGNLTAHFPNTDANNSRPNLGEFTGITNVISTINLGNNVGAFSSTENRWHFWGNSRWNGKTNQAKLEKLGTPERIAFLSPNTLLVIVTQPNAAEPIDLLATIDPSIHKIGPNQWIPGPQGFTSTSGRFGMLVPPVDIPSSYDLELRALPRQQMAVTFPVGKNAATLVLNKIIVSPSVGGFENIDGMSVSDPKNPATFSPTPIATGEESEVLLRIREKDDGIFSIEAFHEGEPLTSWEGDPSRLSTVPHWTVPSPHRVGLGASYVGEKQSTYLSAILRPVGPQAVIAQQALAYPTDEAAFRAWLEDKILTYAQPWDGKEEGLFWFDANKMHWRRTKGTRSTSSTGSWDFRVPKPGVVEFNAWSGKGKVQYHSLTFSPDGDSYEWRAPNGKRNAPISPIRTDLSRPGRLHATGTQADGSPIDLSLAEGIDDFVQIARLDEH